jgi:hypothetical protein
MKQAAHLPSYLMPRTLAAARARAEHGSELRGRLLDELPWEPSSWSAVDPFAVLQEPTTQGEAALRCVR